MNTWLFVCLSACLSACLLVCMCTCACLYVRTYVLASFGATNIYIPPHLPTDRRARTETSRLLHLRHVCRRRRRRKLRSPYARGGCPSWSSSGAGARHPADLECSLASSEVCLIKSSVTTLSAQIRTLFGPGCSQTSSQQPRGHESSETPETEKM